MGSNLDLVVDRVINGGVQNHHGRASGSCLNELYKVFLTCQSNYLQILLVEHGVSF